LGNIELKINSCTTRIKISVINFPNILISLACTVCPTPYWGFPIKNKVFMMFENVTGCIISSSSTRQTRTKPCADVILFRVYQFSNCFDSTQNVIVSSYGTISIVRTTVYNTQYYRGVSLPPSLRLLLFSREQNTICS
jgi:hypothetical protein